MQGADWGPVRRACAAARCDFDGVVAATNSGRPMRPSIGSVRSDVRNQSEQFTTGSPRSCAAACPGEARSIGGTRSGQRCNALEDWVGRYPGLNSSWLAASINWGSGEGSGSLAVPDARHQACRCAGRAAPHGTIPAQRDRAVALDGKANRRVRTTSSDPTAGLPPACPMGCRGMGRAPLVVILGSTGRRARWRAERPIRPCVRVRDGHRLSVGPCADVAPGHVRRPVQRVIRRQRMLRP